MVEKIKTSTKIWLGISLACLIIGIIMLLIVSIWGIMFIALGLLLPTIPLRDAAIESGRKRREERMNKERGNQ